MKLCEIIFRFEPRDLWLGIFWDYRTLGENGLYEWNALDVYICVIPTLPIHFVFTNYYKGRTPPFDITLFRKTFGIRSIEQ